MQRLDFFSIYFIRNNFQVFLLAGSYLEVDFTDNCNGRQRWFDNNCNKNHMNQEFQLTAFQKTWNFNLLLILSEKLL